MKNEMTELQKVQAKQEENARKGIVNVNWYEEQQVAAAKDHAALVAKYQAELKAKPQSKASRLADMIAEYREATGASYATARRAALRQLNRKG